MGNQTEIEYNQVIAHCRSLFEKKTRDYGTAWRILRMSSITDQIFIKAQRIRSIQDKGTQKIEEDITSEFIGIINYCVIALIQLELKNNSNFLLYQSSCYNSRSFFIFIDLVTSIIFFYLVIVQPSFYPMLNNAYSRP